MSVWVVQPRDPLIFRDGKPFNATSGAQAKTLPFPYPSTLVGGMRTQAGTDKSGRFDKAQIGRLLKLQIRGPVLVSLDKDNEIEEWYFPTPSDCLLLRDSVATRGRRFWVHPVKLPVGAKTNLRQGNLVSPNPVIKQKPHKGAPAFWNWKTMKSWLTQPLEDVVELSTLGISGLTSETRIHVKIDPETDTADETFLFQTNGLEFSITSQDGSQRILSDSQQYALTVETEAEFTPGIGFLGGERRVVTWTESEQLFPTCPTEILESIIKWKHCRLLLATPAIFEQGYLPKWICNSVPGLTIKIVAAAVPRYQAISGWDVKEHTQKASRRLAPSGSVYFLSLEGNNQAIEKFVNGVWLHSISDDEQDRCDGFGLALLGTWNGEIAQLEVTV